MSLLQLVRRHIKEVKLSALHLKLVSGAVRLYDIGLEGNSQEHISAALSMLSNHCVYKSIRSSLLSYLLMHCAFLVLESESDRILRWSRIWNLNEGVCHSPSALVFIKETPAFPLD